jgi:radical SAM protein
MPPPPFDFSRSPFIVIWEATRACALACVHCRADAIPHRNPGELTTEEALTLIDQVRALSDPPPLFVITGGDPMRRRDLAAIVRHAADAGLTVAITPSGTAAATRARMAELKDAGLSRVAVSLDGPTPETHDAFRRVRGSYDWTMRIIDAVAGLGLSLQINTTISRLTLPRLAQMAALVSEFPLSMWAVFFLVQTGRGAALDQITDHDCERVLNYLYDLSCTAPFAIKTTEAPHFHRVIWQRQHEGAVFTGTSGVATTRPGFRAPRAVTDGNGFLFVDHLGNICPSGFLPIVRGNVRADDLAGIYRDDEIFLRLRDTDSLDGKCGRCEFRGICGGSRARAFTTTGALMASDPLCVYQPRPHGRA